MQTSHDENMYMMLGEMKSMLQSLVESHRDMKEHNEKVHNGTEERLNSHSDRLRDLENWKWKQTGMMAVISVVAPVVIYFLTGVYFG